MGKKVINISPTAGSTSLITSSGGAIANDNGEGIFVLFALAIGSNFHGTNNTWVAATKVATSNQVNWMDSTDNNFYLTGVQLEVGEFSSTTLPPFQHESIATNLARCQRYYFQSTEGQTTLSVYQDEGSYLSGNAHYPQTMRANPTATLSFSAGAGTISSSGASNIAPEAAIIYANMTGADGRITCTSQKWDAEL